jgi:hypothetical protein
MEDLLEAQEEELEETQPTQDLTELQVRAITAALDRPAVETVAAVAVKMPQALPVKVAMEFCLERFDTQEVDLAELVEV